MSERRGERARPQWAHSLALLCSALLPPNPTQPYPTQPHPNPISKSSPPHTPPFPPQLRNLALERWSGKRGADNIVILVVQFQKKQGGAQDKEGKEEKGEQGSNGNNSAYSTTWQRPSTTYLYDGSRQGKDDGSPSDRKTKSLTFYDSDVSDEKIDQGKARRSHRTRRTELPAVQPSEIKVRPAEINEEVEEGGEEGEEEGGGEGEEGEGASGAPAAAGGDDASGTSGDSYGGATAAAAAAADEQSSFKSKVAEAEDNGEIVKLGSSCKLRA